VSESVLSPRREVVLRHVSVLVVEGAHPERGSGAYPPIRGPCDHIHF